MHEATLLIVNAAVLLSTMALGLWVVGKARRLKRSQDQLIATLDADAGSAWFRINVSRPEQFARRLKLMGFEAKGLLVHAADHVRVLAELPSGERIDRIFPKRDLDLRWLGNTGIASSNMHWIAIGPEGQSLILTADTGFNALPSREATADICRIIAPHFPLPGVAAREFALEKNPASLLTVLTFFGLLLYAFLDGIVLSDYELLEFGKTVWVWGLAAVPMVALPVYGWLARRKVPSRESLTLTLLMVLALVVAYIPAIKRVDQYLAPEGSVAVAYRLGPGAKLEPVSPGPPDIDFSHLKEYWQQFEEGSIHDFDLVHGPLGLWQLDHTRLDKEFKAFYEALKEHKERPVGKDE